jgi:hypothetical protein
MQISGSGGDRRQQAAAGAHAAAIRLDTPGTPTCLVAGSKAQAAAAALGVGVGAPAVQAHRQLVKRQLSVRQLSCPALLGAILFHNLLQGLLRH